MKNIRRLNFSSSISNITNINSSFDKGVIRIAYTGENANGSFISKESFEQAIPTLYNCPVVCNYNRENNSIGGHDIDIVENSDGGLEIVNITSPVGVVPESANVFWEEYNGHEYLCSEVLLWKRQEAYQKIIDDGIVSQSMEISVLDGESKDNVYVINKLEFNGLCLLGDDVKPCFADACLETFSISELKDDINKMFEELKQTYSVIASSKEDNNKEFSSEGGDDNLNKEALEPIEVVEPKNFEEAEDEVEETSDDVVEETPDETDTEPDTDIEQSTSTQSEEDDEDDVVVDDGDDDTVKPKQFELNSNIMEQLYDAFGEYVIETSWGVESKYWIEDIDCEKSEVYAIDTEDWKLYGFSYTVDSDIVSVDFESKKRMKRCLSDFGGCKKDKEKCSAKSMIENFSKIIESKDSEICQLREFKESIEYSKLRAEKDEIISKFSMLKEFDEYKELCSDIDKFSKEEIEEKCFAIKGRHDVSVKFSLKSENTKIKLPKSDITESKYGDLFEKYGYKK